MAGERRFHIDLIQPPLTVEEADSVIYSIDLLDEASLGAFRAASRTCRFLEDALQALRRRLEADEYIINAFNHQQP